MSLSDIWFLYRARLRARTVLVQEGLAIAGIAVGVALLFASQIAATSLTRSVAKMTRQIVGDTQYQLDARGPTGFDERLLRRVQALPGVKVALPVLEQQASVGGPRGQRSIELIGADPRFAHFAGPLLRRFSAKQLAAQQAVALPESLARSLGVGPLETVKLQIGAHMTPTLVGATLTAADIGDLSHSPVAIAPVGYVQRIAGLEHRVTRIFIALRPGHEREAALGLHRLAASANVNLEPADFDAKLFSVAAAPATQSQTLFSAISALVGFMFALNAMLMTAPARRRLLEDVRRQGATRTMTIQILAFDATVLAVLACAAGLALGDGLSIVVFHANPGYLSYAFPVGNQRTIALSSVAIAVAAGFAAAALGVCWPLRDLIAQGWRTSIDAAPRRTRLGGWRLAAGLASLAISAAVLALRPASAIVGVFALVAGLLCLLPPLFDAVIDGFDRLQRPFNRTAPLLAVTELRTAQTRVRSLAIVATAAVAIFGVVAIQGAQANLERGLSQSGRAVDSTAQLWVTPGGAFDAFTAVSFHDTALASIARVPGVKSVGLYRGSFLDWGQRRIWVIAPSGNGGQALSNSQLISGGLDQAVQRLRQGGWAVLSQALATRHGLHVGDAFTLPAPRPIRLRLAAISTNLGWSPGAAIMASDDYARAWGSADPSAYEVQLEPGVSAARERDAIHAALGGNGSRFTVETEDERLRRHEATAQQGLARLTEIRLLVLISAILAVAGAMAAMIWQRRDLVAFIKCQGYRRSVLWRWLLFECSMLLCAGCLIGTLFGLAGQLLISHALAVVTGFPVIFDVGPLIALSDFALLTIAAAAIVAVVGYLVVRVPPRTVSPAY